ncbi:MAG: GLUG motif-containing protein [Pseudomonadota bacterium]
MKRFPVIFRQLLGSVTPLLMTVLVACGANNLDLATQESLTSDAGSISQCASLPATALIGLGTCGGGGGRVVINPNKPVGTAAANRDPGGIPFEEMKITWTYPASDRTGVNFEIQRQKGASFVTLATNTVDPKLYYDRTLAPGTTFTYRINAIDANGNTYSDNFSGTTLLATGSPNAPGYLTSVLVPSPLAIDLTWADQSTNETNFLIERSVDQGVFALLTPAPGLAANTVTYRDAAISYNHSYSYRVYAKNAAGRSPNSNEMTVAIGSEPAPAAPSGLVSTFVSATQITLQFNDNSTNEDSFEVQRKPAGGSFGAIQTLSAQTGTGTVTVQDMSVSEGTSYTYRIKVTKGALFAFSNELPVSIPVPSVCNASSSPFGGGNGSPGNPYRICSPDQLNRIRGAYLSSSFKVEATIDLQNQAWTPMGDATTSFSGTFDGNGYTIKNLKVIRVNFKEGGLFGRVSGSIMNLTVQQGTISGNCQAGDGSAASGGIVGILMFGGGVANSAAIDVSVSGDGCSLGGLVGYQVAAPITNSYATGAVTGINNVGGLVGYSSSGTIANSYATGVVTGASSGAYVGGLVGDDYGPITDSYATGAVTGGAAVGGLVGRSGSITNSYATGAVTGRDHLGGLVGVQIWGTITNSHATGTVTGTVTVSPGSFFVGGLVGTQGGPIVKSYATGAVIGQSNAWAYGGLVGDGGGPITNSYCTGAVTVGAGAYQVGSLVGAIGPTTITNSYAMGAVTVGSGSTYVNGLVGWNEATITASYWNRTVNPTLTSDGNARTTSQMTAILPDPAPRTTYVQWDFGGIWFAPNGTSYPTLR